MRVFGVFSFTQRYAILSGFCALPPFHSAHTSKSRWPPVAEYCTGITLAEVGDYVLIFRRIIARDKAVRWRRDCNEFRLLSAINIPAADRMYPGVGLRGRLDSDFLSCKAVHFGGE